MGAFFAYISEMKIILRLCMLLLLLVNMPVSFATDGVEIEKSDLYGVASVDSDCSTVDICAVAQKNECNGKLDLALEGNNIEAISTTCTLFIKELKSVSFDDYSITRVQSKTSRSNIELSLFYNYNSTSLYTTNDICMTRYLNQIA